MQNEVLNVLSLAVLASKGVKVARQLVTEI